MSEFATAVHVPEGVSDDRQRGAEYLNGDVPSGFYYLRRGNRVRSEFGS